MVWKKSENPNVHRRSQVALAIILGSFLLLLGVALWVLMSSEDNAVEVSTTPIITTEEINQTEDEQAEEAPSFNALELQSVLESWRQEVSGEASVFISDAEGGVLATLEPDEVFFAASIYKLYVAYEGYRQLDEGVVDPSEVYVNGFTRQECLDKMIRESDSPCAEKLWTELGKQETTEKLLTYGLTNTSMTAITTTAADAARILSRIATGEGLSAESQQAFLDSMRDQIYRDTLNKSFDQNTIVYNKIGFRELDEYHDVAIVEFEDRRQLVVSVMTSGVGTSNIVRLGELINESVLSL